MSASPRLRMGLMAAGVSCLFAGYVLAQQLTDQPRQRAQAEQPAQADRPAGQTDRSIETREYTANFRGGQQAGGMQDQEVQKFLVSCLLAKNQAEVEINEFAQQKAQNPEIKEFAQQMVQDHKQLVNELQQLAGAQGAQPADRARTTTSPNATGQLDAGRTTRGQGAQAAAGNSAIDKLVAIERQITEKCVQDLREELQAKQGAEFDKCYIGSQVGGHMQMTAALEVLSQQGPEKVKEVAQNALPTVQQHLDHAKQIAKQLEGQSASSTRAARQPAETQRE